MVVLLRMQLDECSFQGSLAPFSAPNDVYILSRCFLLSIPTLSRLSASYHA